MKILHLTPSYFSQKSILGGAERYVDELAQAQSKCASVSILSFGQQAESFQNQAVTYHIRRPWTYYKKNQLNPLSLNFLKDLKNFDVIHCHQIFTWLTEMAIMASMFNRKKVFLTDHGGGGASHLIHRGLSQRANAILSVSNYSAELLKNFHSKRIPIYGGVDTNRFTSIAIEKKNQIISIGRILPHKGFHHLIKALAPNDNLLIVGKVYDQEYLELLNELSRNKKVTFAHDLSDHDLIREINTSKLAIFPSTFIAPNGAEMKGQPELFGLAPLEVMACNIPVLLSNVGAFPEIAMNQDHLFKDGDIDDLRQKISNLTDSNLDYRHKVLNKLTWDHVASRSIAAYRDN